MSHTHSLDPLFSPESIILIGAAHTERKIGGIVLRNLLKSRAGIYPVNPKYEELMGTKAYASVGAVKELFDAGHGSADLAIIIRPASEVPDILRGLQGWTKTAIVVSAGFAESGQHVLQDEIKSIGREGGIRLLGPNCLGVYDAHNKLDTFFLAQEKLKRPKKGNVAILSQSGAVMTCLFDAVRASNTGMSKAVGYGNAVDIDESDIYDYLADDPHTDIVISYIESVGDGRKFINAAKALSEKKTLLTLKAGKGPGGGAAAFSHTGRLAGRYEVFSSVLRQYGIHEVPDFDHLVDAAKALSCQGPQNKARDIMGGSGRRVCIITNGGGSGVLAADECMRQMLDVAQVPEEKVEKLRGIFPPFYSMNNPVDLTAQVTDSDYGLVLDMLKDDYDGFLVIALTAVKGVTTSLADTIRKFRETSDSPIVLYTNDTGRSFKIPFEKAGIPVYPSPERAARALSTLLSVRR
ncbi:MAG: acetate--CoA ligase family protein [Nitrospirae bacterium]|nr:acetate--CoA ligase family protein [Nitrospirota bacterium]